MGFTKKSSWAIGIAAGIVLIASAADARPRHFTHDQRYPPHEYGRAYDAYGPTSEEFSGTSVPYDPDGPGYNDFQLQGRE
jgi:hypothetical protein